MCTKACRQIVIKQLSIFFSIYERFYLQCFVCILTSKLSMQILGHELSGKSHKCYLK